LPKQQPSDATVVSGERNQQIMVGVDGHETADTGSEPGLGDSPHPPTNQSSEQSNSTAKDTQPQQQQSNRICLVDRVKLIQLLCDESSDAVWICGRIEDGKLVDMVIERHLEDVIEAQKQVVRGT
jgi:hypothetical protein